MKCELIFAFGAFLRSLTSSSYQRVLMFAIENNNQLQNVSSFVYFQNKNTHALTEVSNWIEITN